jgi:hypothetical protein
LKLLDYLFRWMQAWVDLATAVVRILTFGLASPRWSLCFSAWALRVSWRGWVRKFIKKIEYEKFKEEK